MTASLLALGMTGSRRLTEIALLLGAIGAGVFGLAILARIARAEMPATRWMHLLAAALLIAFFVLAIVAVHWGWKG